jgi:ribosomal protein S17E
MVQYWDDVTTVLVTLAMKIGPLDKDGLDLVYTLGDAHNLHDVKGWEIPKKFKHSMDGTRREIHERYKTNMGETLRKIFDNYLNINKKMTLIILTDGLWKGAASSDDVENLIAGFITNLNERLKKWESRWFSIQFVSFGEDEEALKRLDKLDNDMPIE